MLTTLKTAILNHRIRRLTATIPDGVPAHLTQATKTLPGWAVRRDWGDTHDYAAWGPDRKAVIRNAEGERDFWRRSPRPRLSIVEISWQEYDNHQRYRHMCTSPICVTEPAVVAAASQ